VNTTIEDEDRDHLRWALAALAMQALIPMTGGDHGQAGSVASKAVSFADALILALAIPSAP